MKRPFFFARLERTALTWCFTRRSARKARMSEANPCYLVERCISPAQTDEIVWISGRRAACAGNQGRLLGRSRPIRGLRVPAVPKRTAARRRPAVRKLVVLSASIARTGTAVALAREVKADFQLVGCLWSRSGLQLGIRSAFRIFRGTKMGFGCRPCLG